MFIELSSLNVHKKHNLCKYVEAAPLPPFIYKVVGYDEDGGYMLSAVDEDDDEWINDEL